MIRCIHLKSEFEVIYCLICPNFLSICTNILEKRNFEISLFQTYAQPALTIETIKLTIVTKSTKETLEQGVNYIQSLTIKTPEQRLT